MDIMHKSVPEHSYQRMTYTLCSVILYEPLSCIIIYKSSKGANKYTQLIILTIVWL